ncbi:MAG TPA: hypothetical protein ENH87_20215 [Pricia antarctica]|uniref:Uncharacterized protein n=1 Tax=Pricia antarctica TaxID=641691 RepID=A0A831QV04_9FLAO|nr:hypothetical protein [Pricia antarctica]
MSDLKTILREIIEMTIMIERDYPEVYGYLDEDPMTIPDIEKPNMGRKVMQEYLDDLKELVKQYSKTHKIGQGHR